MDRTLFWRIDVPLRQQRAIRSGEWKLLRDGDNLLLFNLKADIGERHDLAAARTDLVSKLLPLLIAWEKDVDAEAKLAKQALPCVDLRTKPLASDLSSRRVEVAR
jgi:hypothetical protein